MSRRILENFKGGFLKVLLFCVGSTLCISQAMGQTYPTWQGSSNNWSTSANWNITLAFGQLQWTGNGSATSNNDLTGPYNQWRLYFSGTKSYTLTGNDVSLFDFSGNPSWFLSDATVGQTVNFNLNFAATAGTAIGNVTARGSGGSLTFAGTVNITGSNVPTLRIASQNTNAPITFGAAVTGSGKNIVIGRDDANATQANSRIVFSGTNTYTGTTTIDAGTLFVNGSTNASSAVTVSAGNSATLGGTGTVNGTVSLSGTIAPGGNSANSIGTLNTGALTIGTGSAYTFDINNVAGTPGPGTNWDYVNSSGAITINATSGSPLTINVTGNPTGFSNTTAYSWKIATGTSIASFASNKFSVSSGGFTPTLAGVFSVSNTGNDLFLNYTPTPTITTVTSSVPTSSTTQTYKGATITLTGTALSGVTTVKLGGSGGTTISSPTISSTQITFTVPDGTIGGTVFISDGTNTATSSNSFTNLGFITTSGGNGNWSSTGNWLGGSLPSSTDKVTVANNLTLDQAATVSSLIINSSMTFTASDASARTLTIAPSASSTSITNSGTWANGTGGSTVIFTAAAGSALTVNTTSGTIGFNNVTINKSGGTSNIVGVTFGTGGSVAGTLEIGNGGYVASAYPGTTFWGASSTLRFNTGATYDVNNGDNSWPTGSTNNPPSIEITSGTVNVNEARIATGNLTINGGTLALTQQLTIQGNWLRSSGTFTPNTQTVVLSGSNNASVSGAGGASFYALTISKSAGTNTVTLSIDLTVTNTLTLTTGILVTGSNTLSISNSAAGALSGGSASSFVNGPLQRTLPNSGTGDWLFPVGTGSTSSNYYPLNINNPASGTTPVLKVQATASSSGGSVSGTINSLSGSEFWQISQVSGTAGTGKVSLARVTSLSTLNAVASSSTQGGSYTSLGGSIGNSLITSNTVTASSTSGVAFYVLANATLPPTITSISSSPNNGTATNAYNGSTITVNGTNFTSGMTVTLSSGSNVSSTYTLVSATQITFALPTGASGTVSVTNAAAGPVTSGSSLTNVGFISGGSGGNWNASGSWLGGTVPSASTDLVTIASGAPITLNTDATISNLTINSSATFTTNDGSNRTLTLSNGTILTTTPLTNNGTWTNGSGTTTVAFTGAPTVNTTTSISGSISLQNCTITSTSSFALGLSVGGASTTISGNLTIGAGAYINSITNTSFWGGSSSLTFDQGASNTFDLDASGVTWKTSAPAPVNVIVNSGTLRCNTGSRTIATSSGTTSLTVNSGAAIAVVSGQTLTQGSGGTILIKSGGRIGSIGAANRVVGTVNFEIATTATRAYRFFSHPFANSIALNELTGANEIDITGNATGASSSGTACTGCTATSTNAPSAFSYNPVSGNSSSSPDPGWASFNDLTTSSWAKNQGIRVLVRGKKGEGLTGGTYTPSATTITISGSTVNDGTNQTITLSSGSNSDYNLVGNPFCSAIQLGTLASGQRTNLNSNFYTWSPTGGSNGRGQYVTTSFGTSYVIPTGGAFFIKKNTGNSITINESDKTSSTGASLFKGDINSYDQIALTVKRDSSVWDYLKVRFRDAALSGYDNDDADKFFNPEFSMYSYSTDNHKLAIDVRPMPADKDVIPLGMVYPPVGNVTFDFTESQLPSGIDVYLIDNYTSTKKQLSNSTQYTFAITADTLTKAENRFKLLFSKGATGLHEMVQLKNFTAYPNPVSTTLNLKPISFISGKYDYKVFNQLGENSLQGAIQFDASSDRSIDVSSLQDGVYFIQLHDQAGRIETMKFVK